MRGSMGYGMRGSMGHGMSRGMGYGMGSGMRKYYHKHPHRHMKRLRPQAFDISDLYH